MQSNYKTLGDYITPIKVKNKDLRAKDLLGINIDKFFMPSVANVVGTDLSRYKVVEKNQFACNRMHVGRDYRIPIALSDKDEPFMVSPAYDVFEINDTTVLHPDYLMMWFSRAEFDRNAWFYTDADVRGGLAWDAFCNMKFPLPSPEKQNEIVKEYNTIKNRIALNNQLIQKLEETVQAIFKEWFVDFEYPDENGNPYKSSGGKLIQSIELDKEIPQGWQLNSLEEIVDSDSPITYGVVTPGEEDLNGSFLIRGGDIQNGQVKHEGLRTVSNVISNKYKRTILKGGEILLTIVGDVGNVGLVPEVLKGANIYRQLALIRISENSLALFIKNLLASNTGQAMLQEATQGSVQDVINLKDLRELPILMPTENLIKEFYSLIKVIENKINLLFAFNANCNELKNTILSKLATI